MIVLLIQLAAVAVAVIAVGLLILTLIVRAFLSWW